MWKQICRDSFHYTVDKWGHMFVCLCRFFTNVWTGTRKKIQSVGCVGFLKVTEMLMGFASGITVQ